MKKTAILLFSALLAFVFLANQASAQSSADSSYDLGPMEYKFHLHFENGTLSPVVKDVLPYDFISEQFTDGPGLYYGRVFSPSNQTLGDFHFDLLDGDNEVIAPYFGDAKSVAFYRSNTDSQPMLVVSVSKTAICNDDKVCQTQAGENKNNCPMDCGGTVSNGNSSTNQNTNNTNASGDPAIRLFNILILVFVMLAVAIVAVFVIMFIRRNKK
jgi:hypothetical protein